MTDTEYATTSELADFLGVQDKYPTDLSDVGLSESIMQSALNRAAKEIEEECDNLWTDGSTATPSYSQVTNEKHDGKGAFDRTYHLDNYPLPSVSTTLTSDLTAGSGTAIAVDSTDGFLTTGTILIGGEKVDYTGKSASQFDAGTVLASAHSSGDAVKPYAIEISGSDSGTEPTWTTLKEESEFDIDLSSGRVFIHRADTLLSTLDTQYPQGKVPNRFRATYLWGNETIPDDIKRLCLMIASRELTRAAVRKATLTGLNDFKPTVLNVDDDDIERTKDRYRNYKISRA